jgi:hypothetical protein
MTNPLIEKYNELYNPKPPELPKPVEKPKPRKLAKCYDPDSLKATFQQVAEKIKNGEAQVVSMNMEMGHKYINTTGARITFEVSLDDY